MRSFQKVWSPINGHVPVVVSALSSTVGLSFYGNRLQLMFNCPHAGAVQLEHNVDPARIDPLTAMAATKFLFTPSNPGTAVIARFCSQMFVHLTL